MSADTVQEAFPPHSFATVALAVAGSPAHFPTVKLPQVPLGVPIEANSTAVNFPFGHVNEKVPPSALQPQTVCPTAPEHGGGGGGPGFG